YPKLTSWVEENIEETLTYYRLPLAHHKHMKSTNMLERLNQEIKRRTLVVRIFPNAPSCLRLVRALAIEIHEAWLEATRYRHMSTAKEQKKGALRPIAAGRRRGVFGAALHGVLAPPTPQTTACHFAELDAHNYPGPAPVEGAGAEEVRGEIPAPLAGAGWG